MHPSADICAGGQLVYGEIKRPPPTGFPSGAVDFDALQGIILVVQLVEALDVRAAGDALERVVAELAAVMSGRNNAVFLTDHGLAVHLAGKLAVAARAVDFFAE